MTVPRLLFVCAANVCRSPAMQFSLAASLAAAGRGELWTYESRGTHAVAGAPICSFVAAAAAAAMLPGGTEAADKLQSRRLQPKDVDSASLVLVASEQERAVVARVRPGARSRTFTLLEACALSVVALDHREQRAQRSTSQVDPVQSFAGLLNRQRGAVAPARPGWRGRWSDPRARYDIPDVHGEGDRAHQRTMARIAESAAALAGEIDRHCAEHD